MNEVTWDAVMDKIRDAMNKDMPVYPMDAGSDGHDRYTCPICDAWWYGKHNYCYNCGQKLTY